MSTSEALNVCQESVLKVVSETLATQLLRLSPIFLEDFWVSCFEANLSWLSDCPPPLSYSLLLLWTCGHGITAQTTKHIEYSDPTVIVMSI